MFALPYYLIWMEKALKATTVLVFAAVLSACAHSVKQPLDGAWTLETVNGVWRMPTAPAGSFQVSNQHSLLDHSLFALVGYQCWERRYPYVTL